MVASLPCPPVRGLAPIPPDQLKQLDDLVKQLDASFSAADPSESPRLVGPRGEEEHSVPEPLYGLMLTLLEHLKRGEAVTFLPSGALLTTQQAARILNVSRTYLNRLLEQKSIPCEMVGRHRRLRLDDVLQFRENQYRQRCEALDRLRALSNEVEGGMA